MNNSKTIYQLASLVMALVITLGTITPARAVRPAAQTPEPSIYWGAMVEGKAPSSANMQPGGVFDMFETRSQKKLSIIHWGQPWVLSSGAWGEFQTAHFDNVRNHGSIPMINWASWRLGNGANQPDFQLRDIYEGRYDAYIQRWATAARNWGHPFFLRFNHESNGWWYPWGEGKVVVGGAIVNGNSPGDFIKAWQHVHNIFTSVGATNVTWVWSMNNMGKTSQYPALSTLYPGDAYVDWTGLTAYNKYTTWTGLAPLLIGGEGGTWLNDSYNEMVAVAPAKPMMLAEFGTIEAGDGGAKKAAWIADALNTQIPITFPKIKAAVWMNWAVEGRSYPIETSQAATDAWAASIGSATYSTSQFANLNTSPIPPLEALPPGPSATDTPLPSPTLPSATPEASLTPEASPTAEPATPEGSPTELTEPPATLPASPPAEPTTLEASATVTTATPAASATEVPATFTASPTASAIPTASPTAAPSTFTASPTAAPAAFIAIADSYIDSANPASTTGGTSTTLYVDGSPVRKTFLKFDLTQLAGKRIVTVKLKFKTASNSAAGSVNSSSVKLVSNTQWKEQYLSYNNPVAISTTVLGTVPANTVPNTWYEITLTPSALQQKLGGLLSVAIESAGADDLLLSSREATNKPQLVVTFTN